MVIIMIPNIIYAAKHKSGVADACNKKAIVIAEQIGRYGCFAFMIFNIPYTYLNFWFGNALTVYLSVNGALCLAYIIFWIICWNRNDILRALSLSIIPSCIFLFSGIVLANFLLFICAIVFSVSHIYISCKNVVSVKRKKSAAGGDASKVFSTVFVIILLLLAAVGIIFGADIGRGAFPLN